MKLINTALLSPRNLAVIGLIAVASHVVAKPLYAAVSKKGQ